MYFCVDSVPLCHQLPDNNCRATCGASVTCGLSARSTASLISSSVLTYFIENHVCFKEWYYRGTIAEMIMLNTGATCAVSGIFQSPTLLVLGPAS